MNHVQHRRVLTTDVQKQQRNDETSTSCALLFGVFGYSVNRQYDWSITVLTSRHLAQSLAVV